MKTEHPEKMNSLVQQDVCALIADLFFGTADCREGTDTGSAPSLPAFPRSDPDWKAICDELEEQAIPLLFSDYLINKDIPESVIEAWKSNCFDDFDFNIRALDVLQWLDDLFAEHGIPYMVLKGTSAAVLYPRPVLRTQGDIDILVAPKHIAETLWVLDQADCEGTHLSELPGGNTVRVDRSASPSGKVEDGNKRREKHKLKPDRHYAYRKDRVYIEVHTRFATLNTREAERLLDHWLYKAIEEKTVRKEVFYVSFPAPPEDLNGLVLLTHINQHLEEGLGLRQIIDWMMFVCWHLDDEGWETFRVKASVLGLEKLAVTVTRMCQLHLGLPEQFSTISDNSNGKKGTESMECRRNVTWCKGSDEQLCNELLDYLFECGNFGFRNGISNSAAMVISHGRGACGFFRNLQKRGEANWDLYQKHNWLRPFAWIYQGWRYAGFALKRKDALSSLQKEIVAGKRRGDLLDRLGATSLTRKK